MEEKPAMTHYELQNIRKGLLDKSGKPISQAAFAKALGVSKTTYAWWEQKRNPISEWAANLINLTADKLKNK